ncbi:BLIP family beta-lactamase inhibitor [Streptomyces sp. NPDC002851]
MRIRCLAALALAAAVAGSAATTTSASASAKPDPDDNYLTSAKYDAIALGTSKQRVEDTIGTDPHCSGNGSVLTCWTRNQWVDQTATFTFNGSDQLYRKEKNYSFAYGWYTHDKPATMTKAEYDQFAKGDTLAEINAATEGTACTDMWVEHPNHPSSGGWKTEIRCTGTVEESYPTIKFFFTDGLLTDKSYTSRNS